MPSFLLNASTSRVKGVVCHVDRLSYFRRKLIWGLFKKSSTYLVPVKITLLAP